MLTFWIIFTIVALGAFIICAGMDDHKNDLWTLGRFIFIVSFFVGLVGCAHVGGNAEKADFMEDCVVDLAPKVCEKIYYQR